MDELMFCLACALSSSSLGSSWSTQARVPGGGKIANDEVLVDMNALVMTQVYMQVKQWKLLAYPVNAHDRYM